MAIDQDTARAAFAASTDFTVGLEEEFALLDLRELGLASEFDRMHTAAQADPVLAESIAGELIASEIEIRSGRVHVNNKALELDPIPDSSAAPGEARHEGRVFAESNAGHRYRILLPPSEPLEDYAPHTVPQNTCFVLGDNRNRSRDSRHFGFVPLGDIVGLVQYIYCPADTWSRFGAFRD